MYQKSKIKNQKLLQKGFSTLELLIATAILLTAISGMILVVFGNQTVSLDSQVNNEAIIKANDLVEQARASASVDFNSLADSSDYDFFRQELLVNNVNNCKKTGIASVSWSTDANRPQLINIKTTFTNFSEAIALGGDCGPDNPPPTGWENIICENPGAPSWDFSPSGIPATGIEIKKSGTSTYAIITGDGSSAGQNDFWVVNVTSRALLGVSPVSINTSSGLNDVDVVGNYAFVTNNDTTKQLRVVDISTLTAPVEILSASRSFNAVGAGSEGGKIFYHNNKVYVGSKGYMVSYNELQIFDVTDPTNPSLNPIGSHNVNHIIYDIEVRNEVVGGTAKTLAYLAVSDSVGNKPKLIVLDVTIPASITPLGSGYNPVPNAALYGTVLDVLGNKVYLGRQRGTGSNHDLFSLNINDPSAVSLSDSALLAMGPGTEARGLIASGPILFLITTDNNDGFQAWNISDPADISVIDTCKYPQEALDMEYDGNFIYVVNKSQDALRIIYDNANPFP
ncbi:MAG: hypothetical protein A3B91_02135 [Candidatus Yanofskybacteria bacterium RIFCSPHIGHO2_02_FULL_41_29]|uniref:Uncharacterized protein n=1 Tax=Candidatus Yanofskybacteria bacterium RIFCSPHIGHO2_01_FULL_41_53 TaxID=1802663 RepID=A0A1F8EIC1_9BACT|nr:MAG: hypothetical protein A2650_04990 [Candidatus Yanofskybacteria bacterium RIFCSPHIGHO2_01_FULL_41_53]OGN12325.1 MAG: hypothetical protein A3B91_02135 [Candidatus Yanofskybacteria bacterium RIFCSPHIGHO2_02_FULL_41_29]OGN17716.1 MAG: hypothetical protein A3F48_00560 [Candidatus Yanofskybacteria bacterium RIFCSPHIGHO2_12_FULL_41_9]OGN22022.1 MAG: hypothetical protein A2916_04330 [Candidatus Yanofskybacteria bacterium RIFCSPLOWO2_01_FULL_41_67]OGN28912.1 MAG: hypothetical protein A3H54_02090 